MPEGEGFRVAEAYVAVVPDTTGLNEKIRAAIEAAVASQRIDIQLGVDGGALRGRIEAAVGAASGEQVIVGLDVDGGGLKDKVQREAEAANAHATVKVDVDDGEAVAKLAAVDEAGNNLSRDAGGRWRNSLGQFASDAEKAAAGVEDLGKSSDSARGKISGSGSAAAGASGGFFGLSGGMGAAIAAALALGPALAALPALAAGAGAGAAVMGMAFAGVAKALEAHATQATAAGGASSGLAATEHSDAVAIRGALQSIDDARQQAAQQAQTSADAIKSAQQGVVDAEQSAARSAVSAAAQVVSAQTSVTNSIYARQQAEKSLAQAQADAQDQINDATNAAADSKLAVEQATLNAAKAQQALDAAQGVSTPEQLAQLDLNLRLAKQALVDATQRQAEATKKATAAQAEGVAGLPSVVSAQHAAEQAVLAQTAAQDGLAKAQQNEADQAKAGARQVADAQQSLLKAQLDADRQRIASTEQVRRAVQALRDMQQQQALSAQSGGASGAAAVDKYAEAMKKLTPEGRAMVVELESFHDILHQLSATAQTATLPGFIDMLEGSKSLLPVVNKGVADMGHQLSTTATAFGHLFQNQAFQDSAAKFSTVITDGFGQFASALPPLLSAIVTDGAKAGPIINSVAVGIHDILATGLPDFLAGLTVNATGSAAGIGALLGMVSDLLGPAGELVGMVSGALGPALADLRPDVKELAHEIDTALLPVMPQLRDAMLAVVDVIHSLLPIASHLVTVIADDLSAGLQIATPLLKDLAGFLQANGAWLKPFAEGVLAVVLATKAWNLATGNGIAGLKLYSIEAKTAAASTKAVGESAAVSSASMLRMAGALGLAYAAGTMLDEKFGRVSATAHETAADMDQMTQSMYDAANGSAAAQKQVLQTVDDLEFLRHATVGNSDAFNNMDTSLTKLLTSNPQQATAEFAAISKELGTLGYKTADVTKLFPQYEAGISAAKTATKLAGDTAATAAAPTGPFQGLALRLQSIAQAGKDTAGQLRDLDSHLSHLDALRAQQAALDAVTKAMNGLKDGAAGTADSIKEHSKSLTGNSEAAMANRDQLRNSIQVLRDFYDKQIAAGVGVDQANATFLTQVDQLKDQAAATYGSRDAVDKFTASLGLIPLLKTTKVTVEDSNGVKTIKTIQTEMDSLHDKKVSIVLDKLYGPGDEVITIVGSTIKVRAEGGPVSSGDTVLVGEKGPEIVQFGKSGNVIPHDQIQRAAALGPQSTGTPRSATSSQKPVINLYYTGTQLPNSEQRAIMYRELALATR